MKVTRVRKFKKGTSEITLVVSSAESERICHAVICAKHSFSEVYPNLERAGMELLKELTNPRQGVFWDTWR